MRKFVFVLFLAILTFSADAVAAQEIDGLTVALPPGLEAGQPGSYDLALYSPHFDNLKGAPLRAMFFIPPGLTKPRLRERPLVIFYHGHTSNPNYYRTDVAYMTARATRDSFALLSVQNLWPLHANNAGTIMDVRFGTNLLLRRLEALGLFNNEAVYTTGFSSGGFVAWLVCMDSLDPLLDKKFREKQLEYYRDNEFEGNLPDDFDFEKRYYNWKPKHVIEYPYAGFASFKGNYYEGTFGLNILVDGYGLDYKKHYPLIYGDRIGYITVGGANDAPRVQVQAPQLREFMENYLGIKVVYKQFPAEGHSLTEENWKHFWELVEDKL